MTERRLRELNDKVIKAECVLKNALSNLAIAASEVLGYEVVADLCHGSEIEFRTVTDDDIPDYNSCIRMEDILEELKK